MKLLRLPFGKGQFYEYHKSGILEPIRVQVDLPSMDKDVYTDRRLPVSHLELGMRYIYIAANYYLMAGEYKEYAFQLSKVLHLVRLYYKNIEEDKREEILNLLKEQIVQKSVRHIYRAYENNNDVEIERLNSIFFDNEEAKNNGEVLSKLIKTNTSASEDVKEILVLYKEIELLLKDTSALEMKDCFVHAYSTVSRKHNRLLELKYKVNFNFTLLKSILGMNENDFEKESSIHDLVLETFKVALEVDLGYDRTKEFSFLINDTLFCYYELVKSIGIYEISYIHSHSILASVYKNRGFWLELFQVFKKSEKTNNIDIKEDLKILIGKVESEDTNPFSSYERALNHYYKTIELHTEGGAYQSVIQNMYYLDDNFNDNLYHFSATLDRMQINSGKIGRRIEGLKLKLKNRSEYKVEEYF